MLLHAESGLILFLSLRNLLACAVGPNGKFDLRRHDSPGEPPFPAEHRQLTVRPSGRRNRGRPTEARTLIPSEPPATE